MPNRITSAGTAADSSTTVEDTSVSRHIANTMLPVVLFVGMHNKAGMKPLDSKTMSGKMIDLLIKELPYKCVKTNLCEVEYMPHEISEINEAGILWHEKYQPNDSDVIVLLGQWVFDNFWKDRFKIVKLPHPASVFGNVNKEKYVKTAIDKSIRL